MNNERNANEWTIQELIVVEGKNDAHALRRAFGKVDVIWTEGFGLTKEKLNLILEMSKRRGVIVCTDPDYAGNLIREKIRSLVPNTKHVYLSRASATSENGNDIGLENVSPEDIRQAFSKVLKEKENCLEPLHYYKDKKINMVDILNYGLAGQPGSSAKRAAVGRILGIGNANAKQFLFRFNRYDLNKEDLLAALEFIERTGVDGQEC